MFVIYKKSDNKILDVAHEVGPLMNGVAKFFVDKVYNKEEIDALRGTVLTAEDIIAKNSSLFNLVDEKKGELLKNIVYKQIELDMLERAGQEVAADRTALDALYLEANNIAETFKKDTPEANPDGALARLIEMAGDI